MPDDAAGRGEELDRVADAVAADVKRRCLELLQADQEARVEVRVNRRARRPLVVRVFEPKTG